MRDFLSGSETPNLEIAIRTLALGGFFLDGAIRNPGYALLHMTRRDEFGVEHKYSFAVFENEPSEEQIETAKIDVKHNHSNLVVISPTLSENASYIEWDSFINLFGGPILSSSVLEPEFNDQLLALGKNQLPSGLIGKPDDLFEIYVRNALEFLFRCRVIRYGQDRKFEARPDGIVIQDRNFTALYDAKAYSNGYIVTEDSIRQFKSYVDEFKKRYGYYFEVNSFIVISGQFPHEKATLEQRSREMQSLTGVPLTFLTSNALVEIINLLLDSTSTRRSINWKRIFVNPVIEKKHIEHELKLIGKDKIIPTNVR